jgi:hypothetical protein
MTERRHGYIPIATSRGVEIADPPPPRMARGLRHRHRHPHWTTGSHYHPHASGGTVAAIGVSLKLTALSAIVAAILAVILHNSSTLQTPSKPTGPTSVVEAFITAINGHNWPRVWQLGGKNLVTSEYPTYSTMILGYRCTDRDVLVGRPTVRGDVVSGSFLADEANGTAHAVQRYVFRYVVRGGVIVSGHQSLVSGSSPPGC